jgi:Asp-tRNA(Asn)/Glu-tRNA(Gln) amidotransferase A subunit family amidase
MTDAPWPGDACSLVDAFRSGERSPKEELEASIAAIEASELNAFSSVDADFARAAASKADVSLPFGGVPMAVKELEPFDGWPAEEASLVFKGERWSHNSTQVDRLIAGGAVFVGQTNASEFGGLGIGITKLRGMTHNPWDPTKTTGGSSAGSAAAVAGGLVALATGGDGGGSIRKPAGFCGLVGLKGTAGRIPRGPRLTIGPMTVAVGPLARSVRDVARWYDVCNGYDTHDPYSLPRIEGWERNLGTYDLKGKTAVIAATLGLATISAGVEQRVREFGESLARDAGLKLVDIPVVLPSIGFEWAMSNLVVLKEELGDRWPACKDDLTLEIAFGLQIAEGTVNLGIMAKGEAKRREMNEAVANIFDQVDFVICACNPSTAFGADITLPSHVDGLNVGAENEGVLTQPANITGVPAISIPVEPVDGLPVGLQVMARHHEDALLLDLALLAERERPWKLTAPAS